MAIYEITKDQIRMVSETRFSAAGVRERADLQRLLREQVQIVSPETLIIAEEFGEWTDSRRRIDLLGLDKDANLVVIELTQTDRRWRAHGTPGGTLCSDGVADDI
jgi:RecB family endonuclease NucS